MTDKVEVPRRVFKLATSSERESFLRKGRISSGLDERDGFVHLSDRSSAPVVASLFFKETTDLYLIEIDAERFPGNICWVVGKMGDEKPRLDDETDTSLVHYLVPDGCVHVYGSNGVPITTIVRDALVPIAESGQHVFPDWL